MPFCPSCKYEYQAGMTICPDCDVALVASLPEEEDDGEKDWAPLARIMSQQVAEMVAEALEAKGISALVYSGAGYFGQAGAMGVSSYQPVGGGFTIMVPRESIEDADREGEVILGEEWQKAKLLDIESEGDTEI